MTDPVRPHTASILAGLPGLRHAFFGRPGGVSDGIYASLNVGYGSNDDPDAVTENRRRAMAALGRDAGALTTVYQVHSPTVVRVDRPWAHAAAPKADALVTDRPGVVLGIMTADCAPVLFADPEAGVVGAAHAGWRGALGGVMQATVAAMQELGARPAAIHAAVGPTIGPESYEVGPEFPAPFRATDPANDRFFRPARRAGHWMFDLPGYCLSVLDGLGLGQTERLDADTVADPAAFFSYRRACLTGEPDYGRMLSAIVHDG